MFFLLQDGATRPTTRARRAGLPIGPINAPDDLFDDEHLLAREFFVTVEHDDVPPAKYPGAPFRFSAYGPAPRTRAPLLGEHTDEVLGAEPVEPNEPRRIADGRGVPPP